MATSRSAALRALAALVVVAAAAPRPAAAQCRCGCCARGGGAGVDASAAATGATSAAPAAAATTAEEERPAPFAPSSLCASCHSNATPASAMRDPKGRPVSPHLLWSATPMASSYRDVIWRAAVFAEVAAAPAREREIVATCIRCHAPMGARTLPPEQVSLALLEPGRADELTADGVSCAVCHRIAADGLGDTSTFVGGFRLVEDGRIVGPHREPFTRPMLHHTGFEPGYGAQIMSAGLCGTCHTVITAPPGAAPGAAFVEQAPYLEWRNSAFASEGKGAATCQACHLPPVSADGARIVTRIARHPSGRDFPPIDPREPFGRHVLVGGNALLPRLLDAAPAAAADGARPPYPAVAALAQAQLSTRTARLELDPPRVRRGTLSFVARVVNLAGHKLPTGHPSRRVWLRVRVTDAGGRVVFASGEHDRAGRIVGAGGAPLASEAPGGPIEPHRAAIRAPGEVQIWESVMEDEGGAPTESLLRAARPRKDDRILPAGWSPDHADAARTRPVGTGGDADFEAGSDAVAYEVALPATARRPLRVEATLLYQPLGARHAAELARGDSAAARDLAAALARDGNGPATVAAARRTVR